MIDYSSSFFSKQERLERYEKTLERFSSNKFAGFGLPRLELLVRNPCVYLYQPNIQWLRSYEDIDLEFCYLDFPEWYTQKPEFRERDGWYMGHVTHSWADMWHMREKDYFHVKLFLESAIKLCL